VPALLVRVLADQVALERGAGDEGPVLGSPDLEAQVDRVLVPGVPELRLLGPEGEREREQEQQDGRQAGRALGKQAACACRRGIRSRFESSPLGRTAQDSRASSLVLRRARKGGPGRGSNAAVPTPPRRVA